MNRFCPACLLYLILPLLLCACSRETLLLSPLPPDGRILAFGDSLTYGSGVPPDQSYPAVLSELTGLEVVNKGVPGEITADGLKRLQPVLDEIQPKLMILIHGGNDALQRLDPLQTEQHLKAMIDLAEDRQIDVLMMAVPAVGIFLAPPPFYEKIALEKQLPTDLVTLTRILKDPGRRSDRIHPNAQGYEDLARAIFRLLQKYGAVE